MLIDFKLGQGSIILRVKIRNSSVTTGAGLTGLTFSSSGLIISTIANNEATATAYTAAGSTIETITTLGTYAAPTATKCRFKEVDSANHKGIYEIQIADARFAVSNAKAIIVSISGATNAAECDVLIPLRSVDPYDGVRFGMTALPNAAAEAAGGLYTRGSGAGQINQANNGQIDTNAARLGGTIQTGHDVGAGVLLTVGTAAGQVLVSGGYVSPNWGDVGNPGTAVNLGSTVIEAAGSVTLVTSLGDNAISPTSYQVNAIGDTAISAAAAAKIGTAALAAGDIDGYTLEQFGKLCLAALAGKLSGAATTAVVIRAADDSKARITATVDADGNRTALTLDATG